MLAVADVIDTAFSRGICKVFLMAEPDQPNDHILSSPRELYLYNDGNAGIIT